MSDTVTEALAALTPARLSAMRRVLDRHAQQRLDAGDPAEADVWRALATAALDVELRRRRQAEQLHRTVYGTAHLDDS